LVTRESGSALGARPGGTKKMEEYREYGERKKFVGEA